MLKKIILDSNGNIDWEANGWPKPNAEHLSMLNGLTTNGMPDDIFDEWWNECDNLDTGWSIDG